MPRPRNMSSVRGVSSHKYAYSYKKVVSSGSHIYQLNPENTYQLHWCPSKTLICFLFQHLLNFRDKSLLRRSQELEKLGRYVVTTLTHTIMLFISIALHETIVLSRNKICLCEKI